MVVALVDRVELMARLERAELVGAELSQDPEQGPYRQPTRQSSVIVVQRRGLEGIVRGIPMQANISGGSLDDLSACLNFHKSPLGRAQHTSSSSISQTLNGQMRRCAPKGKIAAAADGAPLPGALGIIAGTESLAPIFPAK